MTEWEKMLAGKLYDAGDPYVCEMRMRCRKLLYAYNNCPPDDEEEKARLRNEIFGKKVRIIEIVPPFHCDFGINIDMGDDCIVNAGCVFIEAAPIKIGRHCLFGPGVKISSVTHPIDPAARDEGHEYGKPITIGDNVWVGAGAVINPGVTIGANTVIGAGSVVTKDIPANSVAMGVPCRVIREIGKRDREALKEIM